MAFDYKPYFVITINLIPASYGDTILISILPEDKSAKETFILIDCGMKYKPNILPVIKALKKSGKELDLFIITHYDHDHIQSAKKFIKANGKFSEPAIIPIKEVWLNTYRHLQDEKREIPTPASEEKERLQEFIAENSELPEDQEPDEINAEQAGFLGAELIANGYPWNAAYGKRAVCIENGREITVNDNVKLTLLSPTADALNNLKTEFEAVLKQHGIGLSETELIDDAFELYVQQGGLIADLPNGYEISGTGEITAELLKKMSDGSGYNADTAAANGSSIAFILEADGKKLLLLADAHAETIIQQLKEVYPEAEDFPVYFDVVKVAHHGSYRNNHPDLFKLIDGPKFLFSTNGEHQSHQHPDLQTIALVVNRELTHNIKERELIFNHTLEHLAGLDDKTLEATFHYTVKMQTFITLP